MQILINAREDEMKKSIEKFIDSHPNLEELINNCMENFHKLFMLHEHTFFNVENNLDEYLIKGLLSIYMGYIIRENLEVPKREPIDRKYKKINGSYIDENRRLSKLMTQFFGIKYTDGSNFDAWIRESREGKERLKERKQLFNILESAKEKFTEKEKNSSLGHMAKGSFYRSRIDCSSDYSQIIKYIRMELIYSLPGEKTIDKLAQAIELYKYTSQIRSFSYKCVNDLTKPMYYCSYPFDVPRFQNCDTMRRYKSRVYSYIINRCNSIDVVKVSRKEKERKNYIPLNMDEKENGAEMCYAFLYFSRFETIDYIEEMEGFIKKYKKDYIKLRKVFKKSMDYREMRGYGIVYWVYGQDRISVKYEELDCFIEDNKEIIMRIIGVGVLSDGEKNDFYKKNRDAMINFVCLYKRIDKIWEEIAVFKLLDLLHLYVRMKVIDMKIPRETFGYTKYKKNKKPMSIDKVVKRLNVIEKEINDEGQSKDMLKMEKTIIMIWLSIGMYITLNDLDLGTFIKYIKAVKSIMYALYQKIPAIRKFDDEDVVPQKYIEELLFDK